MLFLLKAKLGASSQFFTVFAYISSKSLSRFLLYQVPYRYFLETQKITKKENPVSRKEFFIFKYVTFELGAGS